jgi:hypothetical protein
VRFLGGAIAPPAATLLAATISPSTPFFAGAASVLIALLIVILGNKHLRAADGHAETPLEEAEVLAVADA